MPVTPTYDRTKVLVGQARMFVQKLGTGVVPALPADTVALNGDWPSSGANIWVPVGATEEGLTFRFQRTTESIMIEEQLTPAQVNTTGIDMSADVVLSEDTIDTMVLAFGGGTKVITAPGAGQPGKTELTIGSDNDHYAFGFEAENSFGKPRRVMLPDVVSVGQMEPVFRRAQNARRYATSFVVISAPEDVEIVEITADAV